METIVSIITVSLNAASTIRDTLDSVRYQKVPFGVEHICIDGGSTDGTRSIIEEAAAFSGGIIYSFEPDKGLFDAMNKGLHLARGRYILFLNADDFLVGSLSVANAFYSIDLDAGAPDMVMGDVIMAHLDRFSLWRKRRVPRWLPRYPRLGAHPPHQGNFIRRELLLRLGGFDSHQRLAADTTQFYRLVHEFNATMVASRTIVSFMRMGGASNDKLSSFSKGNGETFRFLLQYKSPVAAALTVFVKMFQKLLEYRIGRLRRGAYLRFHRLERNNLVPTHQATVAVENAKPKCAATVGRHKERT
jgi:glycosyltransferase involved in cell wall biosynthesis